MNQIIKTCFGISSLCADKNHVIFYDADCNHSLDSLNKVETDLRKMQVVASLSTFYVLKSTNGYNAICLDKIPIENVIKLLSNYCTMIDNDFIKFGAKRGYFTLRIDKDKKIINNLISITERKKSFPHKFILENFLNISVVEGDFDNSKSIDIIHFPSDKNGYFEVKK